MEFKFLLALHKPFSVILAIYYVLVNNTVKALPRKRKHQMTRNLSFNLTEASTLKFQALWYSAFIAVYIWFLYWISYDFFVWQKPIAEVNLANLAGAITSIAFIWAGTKIRKHNRINTGKLQQPIEQKPPQKTVPINSMCTHHFGYLHERQKSQEIPNECLTCEKVIQCFSSTQNSS
jgi:hypothetical protein